MISYTQVNYTTSSARPSGSASALSLFFYAWVNGPVRSTLTMVVADMISWVLSFPFIANGDEFDEGNCVTRM